MNNVMVEIVDILGELSPESQKNLLMYIRVAHMAESSVKKSVRRAMAGSIENAEAVKLR